MYCSCRIHRCSCGRQSRQSCHLLRIPSCRFYRADFIVRILSCGFPCAHSLVQILLSGGINCANPSFKLHMRFYPVNLSMRISLYGFLRAHCIVSVERLQSRAFHWAYYIKRILTYRIPSSAFYQGCECGFHRADSIARLPLYKLHINSIVPTLSPASGCTHSGMCRMYVPSYAFHFMYSIVQ